MSTDSQKIMQLEANQKQIIGMVKKLINTNNATVASVKDLEKRVADGEKLDAKQQAALDALKNVGVKIEEAEKVTSTEVTA